MRGILPLLAAAALLAGCLSEPIQTEPTGDAAVASVALPAELLDPKVIPALHLGPGDGEPNIAVGPGGEIYITPVSNFYVSTDGGKSFTDRGTDRTVGHGDGDIVVDERGCVHWLGLGNGIPYQVSCDQGRTFSKAVDVSAGTGSDREWMDVAGPQLATAWRDADGYVANVSMDYGQTWAGKVKVSDDFVGGPIFHDPTQPSRLWIPGLVGNGVDLFVSEDAGRTWSSMKVLDVPASPADLFFPTQIFPVGAQDEAGNLYVVVSMKQDTIPSAVPKASSLYGVFLTTSSDLGKTWSTPRLISTPGKVAVMPFLAAGADGRVAAVWYENVVGLPDDVLPDEWNVKLWESIDATNPQAVSKTVQLNGAPNHVGSVCSNGTLCVAGGDRCLLDYFEVALDLNGQPVVTWSSCTLGTGVGIAVQGTDIFYGGIAEGTPLRVPIAAK